MADPKGFITTPRATSVRRPVDVRIRDWREVYLEHPVEATQEQAGRCMEVYLTAVPQGVHLPLL